MLRFSNRKSVDPNSLVNWSRGNGLFSINQPYGLRVNNSIKYVSPTIGGGFTTALMYGLGEVAGDSSMGRHLGANVRYASGPINVAAGYHEIIGSTGTVSFSPSGAATFTSGTGKAKQKTFAIADSYDFGAFRIHSNVEQTKLEGLKATDYGISGVYKAIPNLELIAGMVFKNVSTYDNLDAKQYSVAAKYSLSKRTSLYASYSRVNNEGNATQGASYLPGYSMIPVSGTSPSSLVVGVRHDF